MSKARKHYDAGKKYFQNQQYALAIPCFSDAIKLSTTYAQAYCLRAKAHFELTHWENVIDDLTKYIELLVNSHAETYIGAEIYNFRGAAYFNINQFDLSIGDYNRSIKLDPNSATYANRGTCYFKINQFELAKLDFEFSLKLNATDYAYNNLAYFYKVQAEKSPEVRIQSTALAVLNYNRALSINPKNQFPLEYLEDIISNGQDNDFMNLSAHDIYTAISALSTKIKNWAFQQCLDANTPLGKSFQKNANDPGTKKIFNEIIQYLKKNEIPVKIISELESTQPKILATPATLFSPKSHRPPAPLPQYDLVERVQFKRVDPNATALANHSEINTAPPLPPRKNKS